MQEEENDKSFMDIFRIIFSRKWLALIVALAITAVGTLALYFGYSKPKAVYSMTFSVNLPLTGEQQKYYPDGTPFSYQSIISTDNLESVKEVTKINVDVEKMVTKSDISIIQDEKNDTKFTVSVKQKYFDDEDVAREYLKQLAQTSHSYLNEMNIEYNSSLELFALAQDYLEQIDLLDQQLNAILNNYAFLINKYGNSFVVGDGRTLKHYYDAVSLYMQNAEVKNLRSELREGMYLMNEDTLITYAYELDQLTTDYESAKFVLEAMQSGHSDLPENAEAIKSQAEKVAKISGRISELQKYLGEDTTVKIDTEGVFAKRLEVVYNRITEMTNTLKEVSTAVYISSSGVQFEKSGIITSEGSLGLILCGVISLVAGIVIACVVAYIVGNFKTGKTKPEQSAQTE